MLKFSPMANNNLQFRLRFGVSFVACLSALLISHQVFAQASLRKEAAAYRTKGYELQMQGDAAGALSMYQKSASFDASYATPHNDMGVVLEQMGRFQEAELAYRRALEIAPGYAKVHANLAMLYERLGQLDRAVYHWVQRIYRGDPADGGTQRAQERLSKLIASPELLDAATAVVAESTSAQRDKAIELRTQGYALQQARRLEGALDYYVQAAEADPAYAAPYNDMAVILEELGRLEEAKAAYKQALVLDPAYVQAHANLALLYEQLGQMDKAMYHWLKRYQLGEADSQGSLRARERLLAMGMSAQMLDSIPRLTFAAASRAAVLKDEGIVDEYLDADTVLGVALPPPVEVLEEYIEEPFRAGAAVASFKAELSEKALEDTWGRAGAEPVFDQGEAPVSAIAVAEFAEPKPIVSAALTINDGKKKVPVPSVNLDIDAFIIGEESDASDVIAYMQFSNDGVVFTEMEPFNPKKSWTLSQGDGRKTVFVNLLDADYRMLASFHNTIHLDASSLTIYVNSDREDHRRVTEERLDANRQTLNKHQMKSRDQLDY